MNKNRETPSGSAVAAIWRGFNRALKVLPLVGALGFGASCSANQRGWPPPVFPAGNATTVLTIVYTLHPGAVLAEARLRGGGGASRLQCSGRGAAPEPRGDRRAVYPATRAMGHLLGSWDSHVGRRALADGGRKPPEKFPRPSPVDTHDRSPYKSRASLARMAELVDALA